MNNISVGTNYACSGCGACLTVCPSGAISIIEDDAGFYVAHIDEKKCINCGKCVKVCSRYSDNIIGEDIRDKSLYAIQSFNNETVKKCSSGGMAHELACWAIEHSYKVVGAVYNYNANRVEHKIVDDIKDISLLDGSKYLQSNPQDSFRNIIEKAKINKNDKYMVFGTPCQIYGLNKVCKLYNMREQFILVEIFCHGVPSNKLWDVQLEKIQKKLKTLKYNDVQFRYKKNDWHSYCLKVDCDKKTFYGARETEIFWEVFFENILLGDACQDCRIRKEKSVADYRIGDYWGRKFQDRTDGISAVFVCSQKAEDVLNDMVENNKLEKFEATSTSEMLKAQNMEGYHQKDLHRQSIEILRATGDIKKAIKYYRSKMTRKQKIKRILLKASGVIPYSIRIKVRKKYSSMILKNRK